MILTFKPSIVRKDMDAVLTCLVEENLGPGEHCRALLKRFSQDLQVPGVYGIREYPRALELLLGATVAGLGEEIPQDGPPRVALSVLSPGWYLGALKKEGLKPVFLDVDPDTCTLRLPQGKRPEETAEIFLIHHHLGFENNLEPLGDSPVKIIEDLSQIFASRLTRPRPRRGSGIFCLDEEGFISALGGVFIYASGRRENQDLKGRVEELDTSQVLTDLQASLALSQLNRLEKFIARRLEEREIFLQALQKSRNRSPLPPGGDSPEAPPHIPYTFPVLVKSGAREILNYARKKRIFCSPAFENSVFRRSPDLEGDYPGARTLALRCLLFPLYPSLGKEDIEGIARVLSSLP
ncbi:MAG: DegT/DnrJ/EryC1/StrS family aminotransferase [Spirochaetales bacterium]|jgi:dTDP-4-amino-4,6-dideoxygalactose transaminase|nr:DegT/DnrJ/EryC1/StrS family aminotransferase [Spirochaetales bacterium]